MHIDIRQEDKSSALLGFILPLYLCILLGTSVLQAQTRVKRYDVTKETDFGIVYRLPETKLHFVLQFEERGYTPGPLARYADKYLGQKASSEARVAYTLQGARLILGAQPDSTQQFLVAFDRKTLAPFVKLTDKGILYSINGNEELPADQAADIPLKQVLSQSSTDQAAPALPREYSQAGSQASRAEIAASYLYELRESSMNVLTGSVDNMPKDGESMRLVLDRLRKEEARTLRLFAGDTTVRTLAERIDFSPTAEELASRTIARFSPLLGLLAPDDLRGTPITLSIKALERAEALEEKAQRKHEKLLENSIVYRLPGLALVTISWEGQRLLEERVALTQLGSLQALAQKMLHLTPGKSTSVYLDTRTGAIRDIKQE